MNNLLVQLSALGQSVWLDLIRRSMLGPGGELERLIADDGLRGVTSNPAIFEKAIGDSSDYDHDIRTLGRQGKSTMEIYETLALEDVARAADQFRPVYDASGGADGFVSIEVSPKLALDTPGSIAEARRLWSSLGRPNILVKVPGTKAGLPAIRRLLREGVNVNITLLFAVERYVEVHEAYLEALEERVREGERIDRIASVASFFLSRIDTLIDPAIDKIIRGGGPKSSTASELLGTIAIANAKIAYQKWLEVQRSERWTQLARKGARPQRLLWASTGTKNPSYSDTLYVDALVAPHTVNTMPLDTLKAYRDHGKPAVRIEEDLPGASRRIDQLREIGLDLSEFTLQLEREGIRKFVEPLDTLLHSLERKLAATQAGGASDR